MMIANMIRINQRREIEENIFSKKCDLTPFIPPPKGNGFSGWLFIKVLQMESCIKFTVLSHAGVKMAIYSIQAKLY